ncbi:MAG: hypothetical protein SV422_16675 [Pseudomonadota bacterium]|nr:hypothetical protein [Pseudomonadota bacterium]
MPVVVAASTLLATSTAWLLIGWTVTGKISLTQLDFIFALSFFFVREMWIPLLVGLPTATLYLDIRRRCAALP